MVKHHYYWHLEQELLIEGTEFYPRVTWRMRMRRLVKALGPRHTVRVDRSVE